MDFDFDSLEPQIRQILTAPGVNLAQIIAKSVRHQLLALEPSLTPSFVKENKDAVDSVIKFPSAALNFCVKVNGLGSKARNSSLHLAYCWP